MKTCADVMGSIGASVDDDSIVLCPMINSPDGPKATDVPAIDIPEPPGVSVWPATGMAVGLTVRKWSAMVYTGACATDGSETGFPVIVVTWLAMV